VKIPGPPHTDHTQRTGSELRERSFPTGDFEHVPAAAVPSVVDTTEAGDSFAGPYVEVRVARIPSIAAATTVVVVAAVVVANPGAIMLEDMIRTAVLGRLSRYPGR
jgi:sugar/nucleoside kinase (ribokinase family)